MLTFCFGCTLLTVICFPHGHLLERQAAKGDLRYGVEDLVDMCFVLQQKMCLVVCSLRDHHAGLGNRAQLVVLGVESP